MAALSQAAADPRADLHAVKSVDKFVAYVGDTITYSIAISNSGTLSAGNVVITDPTAAGTLLVPGSLMVSVPYTSLPNGAISLSNPVPPGQTVTLSFRLLVETVPNPNPIRNVAAVDYTYRPDPQGPEVVAVRTVSNSAVTTVFRNNYSQQISDLIESVALEEAALAAIMNAEGAKIQRLSATPGVTTETLLCLNKSVADMADTIALLQSILKQKLSAVECQISGTCGD